MLTELGGNDSVFTEACPIYAPFFGAMVSLAYRLACA